MKIHSCWIKVLSVESAGHYESAPRSPGKWSDEWRGTVGLLNHGLQAGVPLLPFRLPDLLTYFP